MLVNIRGWRARQANARMRQAQMAHRWAINKERLDHYNRQADETPDAEAPDAEVQNPQDEAIDVESLSNANLRAALAEAGLDVPKTTARTRLIELYREHVV